jgi:hypothetical protein
LNGCENLSLSLSEEVVESRELRRIFVPKRKENWIGLMTSFIIYKFRKLLLG